MSETEYQELKEENARLRQVIKSLRAQLARYQRKSRRDYEVNSDHVPYHEEDREQ